VSKGELLFIRGDTEGAYGAIKFYWPFFYVARLLENSSYEPRTLLTPSATEALEALAGADAAIIYGHGNAGKVWLKPHRGAALDTDDVRALAQLRLERAKQPMDFVHIACCETCKDKEWVQMWLEVTEILRGYEVDTYDPRNPFVIPDCKTYIKASQDEGTRTT
jgi:hypothetical protein